MVVLGIDGGGTTTRCLVVDDEVGVLASEIGQYCALAADPKRSIDNLGSLVHRSISAAEMAWHMSHTTPLTVRSVCVGLSGLSTSGLEPEVRLSVLEYLKAMHQTVPERSILVVSDTRIAHTAALGGQPGVVLIAGTGAVAIGRSNDDVETRADGWGWLLGDAGSGYNIGHEALRAAFAAFDGRGRPTLLTEAVLSHFNTPDFPQLARLIYNNNVERSKIAALATLVMELATSGDSIAGTITKQAAQDLTDTVLAVVRRIEWDTRKIPVSFQGGLIQQATILQEQVRSQLVQMDTRCTFIPPQGEPVEGAVRLARELTLGISA